MADALGQPGLNQRTLAHRHGDAGGLVDEAAQLEKLPVRQQGRGKQRLLQGKHL